MNETTSDSSSRRALERAEWVDAVCVRFEAAWQSAARPRIEDYLAGAAEPQRTDLLHELISLEVEYRRRRGEDPQPDEYHRRFPNLDSDWLAGVVGAGNDVLLTRLADEFAARYRAGERPALQDYIDRYPDLADDIRELFPAMVEIEQVKIDHDEAGERSAPAFQQLGDFRIIREVGKGGMGIVYEAEQLSLGRHVALKVLPKTMLVDAKAKRRFEREAKSAARLHHTNIVPVFGVGEQDGMPYYVMQFIQGLGLDEVLEELKKLQAGDPKTGMQGGGELRVSRNMGHVANLPGEERQGKNLPERELSAANLASVLLTGEFEATSAIQGDKNEAPELEVVAGVKEQPSDAPPAFVSSNVFTLSSSSAALPGRSGDDSKSRNRKQAYWQKVASIGVQVAGALEYAHKQGIHHRDIKPSNLLLDTQGTVWVTDFGLAKTDDQQNLTHAGDILGTLRYMPPEAFEGKTDARSDVYSLGLTLYEMLAFRPAFDERERNKLIKQVTTAEAPRLDALNPALPRDLVTIVQKASEREPGRRYATAGALADDLQRFLADEPIQARRQTQLERYLRWARRNPGIAVLGSVLSAVLVLGTVASLLAAGYFNRLRLNEAEAAQNERAARQAAEKAGDAERWERYRSNIAATAAALQLQNSSTARRALEAAPEQHRNWEWRYFHSQLEGASRVLAIPHGPLAVMLSPDGRQFATSSGDNAVYLWDTNAITEQPLHALRGHSGRIQSIAYSPDGRQFASGSHDSIRLWDPATGQQRFVLPAEGPPVLYYSPDSRRLISHEEGGQCRLWDTATGKLIAMVGNRQQSKTGLVIYFAPDGKRVGATAGKFVCLYDAATGRQLASLGPHEWLVGGISFSPDGKWICARRTDPSAGPHTVYLWDTETGNLVAKLIDHKTAVMVRFSLDGTLLATASNHPENLVRLWDSASGKLLHTLSGHANSINGLNFSPDGTVLATASIDQTARLWDVKTGTLKAVLRGHSAEVSQVIFSPDGRRLVTQSLDDTMRLWNATNGDLIAVLREHTGRLLPALYTPDGSRLVSSSAADGTVRIWNLELLERNGILRGHTSFVYDVAFSPDGAQVASAGWDGTARLWDATTGRQTGLLQHERPWVTSLAYSRDGRTLATAVTGLGSTLWDLRTGKPQQVSVWKGGGSVDHGRVALSPDGRVLAYARHWVRLYDTVAKSQIAELPQQEIGVPEEAVFSPAVAFNPDGGGLVTGGWDGTIRFWDTTTWQNVSVLHGHTGGGDGAVYRVAFSADGKLLASGSLDNTIRLCDARTHEHLATINMGGWVYGLAFSPDGTRLAAGCRDNTIRLIDVATRQEVAELRGHTDYVHAVAWSPDGTRLVSGSGDGTVRIWDSLSVQARARRAAENLTPR